MTTETPIDGPQLPPRAKRADRRWLVVAIAVIAASAVLVAWQVSRSAQGSVARHAAAEQGIEVVGDDWVKVEQTEAGFRVCVYTGTGDSGDFEESSDICDIAVYTYEIVPATAGEADGWQRFEWPDGSLDARWDPAASPDPLLVVDAGYRSWKVRATSRHGTSEEDVRRNLAVLLDDVAFIPSP
ncbi:hypothetical protein QQX09_13845 [Demequina sp. SYSU T00192]|uniref:Uncharacterized protein n=1 Tax=Demequina litoralis TaxID=3051660 RepID=A0ABT8GD11_9MICO|nr:hypothetical protein [Demequina sp. SYSU T00192]MDN4476937.1 hypothetical protein [Demequina sp. SYSU T00192]